MCWFRYGNSDAPRLEQGRPAGGAATVRVDGLGLVDAALCPHMTTEPFRWSEVEAMMRRTPGVCIALDDRCAVEVLGDRYRILGLRGDQRGYRVTSQGSAPLDTVLLSRDGEPAPEVDDGFRPLRGLTWPVPS
jgi:hypothetical protein